MGQLLQSALDHRQQILALLASAGASEARIFGSAIHADETPDSDLDLLVSLPRTVSLFEVARLQGELSNMLQRRVDLVIEDELHPRIREQVLREALPL